MLMLFSTPSLSSALDAQNFILMFLSCCKVDCEGKMRAEPFFMTLRPVPCWHLPVSYYVFWCFSSPWKVYPPSSISLCHAL